LSRHFRAGALLSGLNSSKLFSVPGNKVNTQLREMEDILVERIWLYIFIAKNSAHLFRDVR
jgi:hypothetical protein